MPTDQSNVREQKKRQRKVRHAILDFLKKLRKACETFKTADDWYKYLKQLESLLQEYEKELPAGTQQRLKDAIKLTDSSREGIKKACKVLQTEILHVIEALPAGGILPTVLIGAVIATAVAVGAIVSYFSLTAVPVIIINDGCDPLHPPQGIANYIPGLDLPKQPILKGEKATAKVPPVMVDINAKSGTIIFTAMGITVPFEVPSEVTGAQFDGMPILDQSISVHLGDREQHELVVTCR